ncbi:growth hormone secretagogue receptor type 1 [Biomphalaria glabrata]|nr:growth hormone secretagogue receptor type 1 [Biomphalaria glabrata]
MSDVSIDPKDSNSPISCVNTNGEYLSYFATKIFFLVNHVIIDMCICVFGIVGNCLNITVFVKQGLRTSVNLSLCAMSLSDLIGLIFQVWHNFCLNPYLELAELPVDFLKVQILTAGCPNIAMTRITGWITVYITAERCLSVLLPLRIKQIVTFRRSVVILLLCYAVNLAFLMPLYSSNYLSWNFYPSLNKTMLGESSRSNEALADLIMNTAHLYLSVIAFCCVVIFTVALVVSLKRKSEWRRRVTSDRDQNEARSSREKKTVGMIIMVAAILIVCYAPGVTITFVEIFNSEFRISSKQANMYNAVWSFCFVFNSINASINVIVYYKMSSKYRTTLQDMFRMAKKSNKTL